MSIICKVRHYRNLVLGGMNGIFAEVLSLKAVHSLSALACVLHLIGIALAIFIPNHIREATLHEVFSDVSKGAGNVDAVIVGRGYWGKMHLEI